MKKKLIGVVKFNTTSLVFVFLFSSLCFLAQEKPHAENTLFQVPNTYKQELIKSASIPDSLVEPFFSYLADIYKEDAKAFIKMQSDGLVSKSNIDQYILKYKKKYFLLYRNTDKNWLIARSQFTPTAINVTEENHSPQNKKTPPSPLQANGPCVNIDFEDGTLNGWEGGYDNYQSTYGFNDAFQTLSLNPGTVDNDGFIPGNTSLANIGNHTIMLSGNDPLLSLVGVNLPRVNPNGGSVSLRLGNDYPRRRAETIYQQFLVTPTNNLFTYHYACVLNDGGHTPSSQAFFQVRLFDQNSNEISCASYDVNATTAASTGLNYVFVTDQLGYTYDIYYNNWKTVAVPLTSYIGQNITAIFLTSDCSEGAHFGYTYIDMECGVLNVDVQQQCPYTSAQLTAPQGFASYSWTGPGISGNSNSQNITANQTGVYNVHFTTIGNNPCSGDLDTTINIYTPLSSTLTQTDILCNGSADGIASVSSINGGMGPYSYQWSNNETTADISGLSPGNYQVTITDGNGCTFQDNLTISEPLAISVGITTTSITCADQNDGTATAQAQPAGTYSYQWSNNQTTQVISGLSQGAYSVTVTDQNGCTAESTAQVDEGQAINFTANSTDAICGQSNGAASVSNVQGGSPGYTYQWSPTGGNGQSESNLAAGTYSITVTDQNGCSHSEELLINNSNGPSASIQSTSVTCFGGNDGQANVIVQPTGTYTYLWSTNSTAQQINNLSQGAYSVTVTDQNGCTVSVSDNISEPTDITFTTNSINASCGQNNGTASVSSVQGGSPGYTYQWGPTGGNGQSESNLAAGTYSITVSDQNGCTKTDVITISNVSGPTVGIITASLTCNGSTDGTAQAQVQPVGSYAYLWNNNSTNQQINNLQQGIYSVTVTDQNGCTGSASHNVTEPTAITISTTSTDASCGQNNGSISVQNTTGGIPNYTYLWNTNSVSSSIQNIPAGAYSVTVTDGNGCTAMASGVVNNSNGPTASIQSTSVTCFGGSDGVANLTIQPTGTYTYFWSNAATTQNISGLLSGVYSVTITDNSGCNAYASEMIQEPTAISFLINGADASCGQNNGTASVSNIQGGFPNYTFQWIPQGANTQNISNLAAGSYSVTVTDQNGCSQLEQITINNSNGPSVSLSVTNSSCSGMNNGSVTAQVQPAGIYIYSWSNGSTSGQIINLSQGAYSVTITDQNGCTALASGTVSEGASITFTLTATNTNCGQSIGSASVTNVNGGNNVYSYLWNNNSTAPVINNLPSGLYSVTVSDQQGCAASKSISVGNNNGPTVSIITTSLTCNGFANGSAQAQVQPSGNYIYLWNNNSTNQQINNLQQGIYSVTVTDNSGCSTYASETVQEPISISVSLTATDASCGQSDGSVVVSSINGGQTPYGYLWSTNNNTSAINNLQAGIYTVTVSDQNNCTQVASTTVQNTSGVQATIAGIDISCNGMNDGAAQASPASSNYFYLWNTTATTSSISGLSAGVYSVTITDAGGSCFSAASVTIQEPNPIVLNAISPVTICSGQTATLSASTINNPTNYQYVWQPGNNLIGSTIQVMPIGNTTYTVTAMDLISNCISEPLVVVVNTTDAPVVSIFSDVQEGCAPLCVQFYFENNNNYQAQWQFSDNTSINTNNVSVQHCFDEAGNYSVSLTLTDTNGCSNNQVLLNYIKIYDNPVASFIATPKEASILDPTIQFTDLSIGATHWSWTFGEQGSGISLEQHLSHQFPDTGSYPITLIVTNDHGCVDMTTDTIHIYGDYISFIPNTFTPNGDGNNDVFNIKYVGVKEHTFNMYIYDRWGDLIYKTNDIYQGWDGKANNGTIKAQIDTYVYKIEFNDIFNKFHQFIGHVNLLK